MAFGTSIILVAVGAILRFAVTLHSAHVNWAIVGDILMAVGALGLLMSLVWVATTTRRGDTTVVEHERRV